MYKNKKKIFSEFLSKSKLGKNKLKQNSLKEKTRKNMFSDS